MRAGEDLYHLDEGALSGLDADLVVTQDLCAVCAVDVSVVDDALAHLGCSAEVLTIDPHTLDEVLESIADARGRPPGSERRGDELVRSTAATGSTGSRRRSPTATGTGAAGAAAGVDRPAVRAGSLGPRDDHRRGRRTHHRRGRREVGPGDLGAGARRRPRPRGVRSVRLRPRRARRRSAATCSPPACCRTDVPVWAVDANASFARPGPRLVDGVESLARIIAGLGADRPRARRLR